MVATTGDLWRWHHNVSECYYHLQLTVKYRRSLFSEEIKQVRVGVKERYEIEVHRVGYDKNHVHVLCRFLPGYSGGQLVRLMKSIATQEVFRRVLSV